MYKFFLLFSFLAIEILALEASSVPLKSEPKQFIKVGDISSSATQTITDLKEHTRVIEAQEKIVNVSQELEPYMKSIDKSLTDIGDIDLKTLSVKELSLNEQEYKTRINQLTKWNTLLESRLEELEESRLYFETIITLWNDTLQNAKKEKVPKLVKENILNVIKSAKELESSSKKRYDKILRDSSLINKNILELSEVLDKIVSIKQDISNSLFEKNSLDFSTLWIEKESHIYEYLQTAFIEMQAESRAVVSFYKLEDRRVFLFAFYSALIFTFVFYFNYLYRKRRLFTQNHSYEKPKYFFIALPLSTATVLVSLLNYFMFSDIPTSVRTFQFTIVIVPLFFIIKKSVPKELDKYFYIFILLYALSIVERYATGYELDSRFVSMLVSFFLALYLFFVIKKDVFILFFSQKNLKYANAALGVVIVLLGVSLFADLNGFTLLASKITAGVLVLFYAALIFYVFSLVLQAYIIILLRRRIASVSQKIERFTTGVEKSLTFFIKLFMMLWFIKIFLNALGVWKYVLESMQTLISLSWKVGEATISVESIFNFTMIIFVTWFLVKITNIILEVELFSRFRFSRGIPTAIQTTLNYLLVTVGLLIALSSLGITVEQFALIFGALGVGIGFGIRNIIANFISGIIMVFERPIQIGDTIVINNTMGQVQSIKMRSSIIKTFDGSEVIIPNADFIAKEITNWTLSDEKRRKTVTFKVDIQSDIDKVLEIMKNVVSAHDGVLKDPEPIASFLGFSEYYLEFKLYFWLHENIIMTQSEITAGIFKALRENGIKMPIPKHDIQKVKEEE